MAAGFCGKSSRLLTKSDHKNAVRSHELSRPLIKHARGQSGPMIACFWLHARQRRAGL